jgi:hypothetical protein
LKDILLIVAIVFSLLQHLLNFLAIFLFYL